MEVDPVKRVWCLGFVISPDLTKVLLLRKSATLHIGLWNGLGGKLEKGESAVDAMVRECKEESGLRTDSRQWKKLGNLIASDRSWRVEIFAFKPGVDTLNGKEFDEISAEWQLKAPSDKPHWVAFSDLHNLKLAPHTAIWAHAGRESVVDPNFKQVDIIEKWES